MEVAKERSADVHDSDQCTETENSEKKNKRGAEALLLTTRPKMQHQSTAHENEHRLAARVLCKLASYGRKDCQGEGEAEIGPDTELEFARRTSSVNTSMPRLNVSRLEEWLQELQPALPHQLPFGAGPAPSHHGEVALAALPAATGVSHSRSRADIEAPAEGKTAPVDAPSGPWSTGRAEKAANLVGLEHGKRTEQQPQLHRQQAAGAGAEPPHAEQGVAAPGIGGRVATGGGAGAGTGSPAEGLAVVGAEAPSRVGVHRSPPSSR